MNVCTDDWENNQLLHVVYMLWNLYGLSQGNKWWITFILWGKRAFMSCVCVCVGWNVAVCAGGMDPDASACLPVSLSGTAHWLTASAQLPPRNGSSQRHVPAGAAARERRPCGCAWACERKARVAADFPGYCRHLETRSNEIKSIY